MKTALVIGASRGIGRAIAERLAHDGFDIVGTCRSNPERFQELEQKITELGRSFHALAFDIADRKAAEEALLGYFGDGAPDVLVYNAGINDDDLFAMMTPEQWDRVLHTNADGFFNCIHPLIMNMMGRRGGRII
ncbi:MAG TPA: 3-oxoacyl-ACP reductase, partial [Lentisphaeria bacterium]|nr:3-oxoacyl-ACP reductase [Lentisphaeria bacterium]